MKLNQLSASRVKKLLVKEEIKNIDDIAGEELDGIDLDVDVEEIEPDDNENINSEIEEPQPPPTQNNQEYGLRNVRDQLNGMIEKWFQLAQDLDPNKKESFLKLGDRLSEITDVIESEFLNA